MVESDKFRHFSSRVVQSTQILKFVDIALKNALSKFQITIIGIYGLLLDSLTVQTFTDFKSQFIL